MPRPFAAGTILLILLAVSWIMYQPSVAQPTVFEYAVQVNPVTFIIQPQPRVTVQAGQTISLSCQANVSQIVNRDTALPSLKWHYNGESIASNSRRVINTKRSIGYSQILLASVTESDAGTYDCVADDAGGRYITVSDPAHLTVFPSESIQYNISVESHQSLLLNCNVSDIRQGNIVWTFNDALVPEQEGWSLSNGSIIIFNVSSEGVWQCRLHTGNVVILVASYHVNLVSTDSYDISSPLVIIDAGNTTLDDSVTDLYCITTAQDPMQVIWYYGQSSNDVLLSVVNSTVADNDMFVLDLLSANETGFYVCQVMLSDGNIISSPVFELTIKSSPSILHLPKAQDIYLPKTRASFALNCSVSGSPTPDIRWLKNGQELSTDGHVQVYANQNQSLFGIYQCIAENEFGRESILVRVLVQDLANPVDVTVTQTIYSFNVSLTRPIQNGNSQSFVYEIRFSYRYLDFFSVRRVPCFQNVFDDGVTSRVVFISELYTSCTQELRTYDVEVSIRRDGIIGRKGSDCVDTRVPYYQREAPVSSFKCNTDGTVSVRWVPPSPELSSHPVRFVTLSATCLYGEDVKEFEYREDQLADVFERGALLKNLPAGTVCQFYGKYKIPLSGCPGDNYLSIPYYPIPSANCQVPIDSAAESSPLALNLSATDDAVEVFWRIEKDTLCSLTNTSQLLNITIICYNRDEVRTYSQYINMTTLLGGSINFSNISSESVCTITASTAEGNVSAVPVQFIRGASVPAAYQVISPVTADLNVICSSVTDSQSASLSFSPTSVLSSTVSFSAMFSSPITVDSSTDDTLQPATNTEGNSVSLVLLLSVIFATVSTVLVVILIILAVFLCLRQKKKRLMFDLLKNESLAKCYSPDLLMPWTDPDNVSIKTDIECPYYQLSVPKVTDSIDMLDLAPSLKELSPDKQSITSDSKSIARTSLSQAESTPTLMCDDDNWQVNQMSHNTSPVCNDDSGCSVQVGDNGFAFTVDKAHPVMDTSACSSGYGSASSSTPSQDYHASLEPELAEAKKQSTKAEIDTFLAPSALSGNCFVRAESCPDFLLKEDGISTAETSVVGNENIRLNNNSSITSTGSLSCESMFYSEPIPKDKLSNVIYVDEKGYIRFVSSHEQVTVMDNLINN